MFMAIHVLIFQDKQYGVKNAFVINIINDIINIMNIKAD